MLDFIKSIAFEAGSIALRERERLNPENIHSKSSPKDIVTDVDLMIEKYIVSSIKKKFPAHDVYGEETGKNYSGSEYCWIIDPIDGTASYVHQTAFFSISIALHKDGEPVAGAVYAPVLEELFLAEKGGGAFLNGERIKVSSQDNIALAMAATGFACLRSGFPENNLKYFPRIAADVSEIRRCGSAALDLAYVACARYDAFWEIGLNIYDVAAGVLLIKEAGGSVTDLSGGTEFPGHGLVASNGLLQNKFLSYFKS